MADKDTIIVVGVTRTDDYGSLWVTPAGGGDEIKIGEKRSHLHDLFQQGKAVMLHWATYKNKPYVSDAKAVEGELPPSTKPESPPPQQREELPKVKPAPQELGMWWKELGEMIRAKDIDTTKPSGKAMRTAYYAKMLSILDIKIENK